MLIESAIKMLESRLLQFYNRHTFFDIFNKNMYIAEFEYTEFDFEIVFYLSIHEHLMCGNYKVFLWEYSSEVWRRVMNSLNDLEIALVL